VVQVLILISWNNVLAALKPVSMSMCNAYPFHVTFAVLYVVRPINLNVINNLFWYNKVVTDIILCQYLLLCLMK
jgi:hypothetical protein